MATFALGSPAGSSLCSAPGGVPYQYVALKQIIDVLPGGVLRALGDQRSL
jgi:hypothetical protein